MDNPAVRKEGGKKSRPYIQLLSFPHCAPNLDVAQRKKRRERRGKEKKKENAMENQNSPFFFPSTRTLY